MIVSELIRHKRREKNLTQQQLAEQLFLSSKTISKWETGRGLPEIGIVPNIANILDIPGDTLLEAVKETLNSRIIMKDKNLRMASIVSLTINFIGYLFLLSSLGANTSSVLLALLGIAFIITSYISYFVFEHFIKNKIRSNKIDTINHYRNRIFIFWYLFALMIPFSIYLPIFGQSGVFYFWGIILVIVPTVLFGLAKVFLIKK